MGCIGTTFLRSLYMSDFWFLLNQSIFVEINTGQAEPKGPHKEYVRVLLKQSAFPVVQQSTETVSAD